MCTGHYNPNKQHVDIHRPCKLDVVCSKVKQLSGWIQRTFKSRDQWKHYGLHFIQPHYDYTFHAPDPHIITRFKRYFISLITRHNRVISHTTLRCRKTLKDFPAVAVFGVNITGTSYFYRSVRL